MAGGGGKAEDTALLSFHGMQCHSLSSLTTLLPACSTSFAGWITRARNALAALCGKKEQQSLQQITQAVYKYQQSPKNAQWKQEQSQ